MFQSLHILALWLLASSVKAQTHAVCSPLKQTCPNDPGLKTAEFVTQFAGSKAMPAGWHADMAAGQISFGPDGASLAVGAQGDSPGLVSDFYLFFGSVEVKAKAASGAGIVSSIVLLSDDLDEIDWEFVGPDTSHAQSNYFGKGDDSTFDRGGIHTVASPQSTWHTYKIDWTPEAIVWSVDGVPVRKTAFAEAKGGSRFPQTPSQIKIGIWAAGDPSMPQGTADWAGGRTDYRQGPFVMSVASIKVVSYSPAREYRYTDKSGSWQSIEVVGGKAMSNGAASQVGSVDVPKQQDHDSTAVNLPSENQPVVNGPAAPGAAGPKPSGAKSNPAVSGAGAANGTNSTPPATLTTTPTKPPAVSVSAAMQTTNVGAKGAAGFMFWQCLVALLVVGLSMQLFA